jgi:hypothetical protein
VLDVVKLLHEVDGQLGLAVHRGEGHRDQWKQEALDLIGQIRAIIPTLDRMPRARLIRFRCDVHGSIWDQSVWCQHDIEDAQRRVAEGHRAAYGADCAALMHVELLDPETMEPAK